MCACLCVRRFDWFECVCVREGVSVCGSECVSVYVCEGLCVNV